MGARPVRHDAGVGHPLISIHAPAWGRDCVSRSRCKKGGISIHAPAWGRDNVVPVVLDAKAHFNPRARMGARPAEINCRSD